MNANSKRDPETHATRGAAMEVRREPGNGFLEGVHHDALELEFARREIPYIREQQIPVAYEGQVLGTPDRADFARFDSVVVESKAIKASPEIETAQVLHHLKATALERALPRLQTLHPFGKSSAHISG